MDKDNRILTRGINMLRKKHLLPTLDDLKALRKKIVHVHGTAHSELTPTQRFAVFITNRIGTMGFFITVLIWTALWLGWNIAAPEQYRFDPAPTFLFWLFVSNLIQLLLMPLIMIGQNLQNRHSEIRGEAEFELEQKMDREMEHIVKHLENVETMLHDIYEHFHVKHQA